MPEQVGRTRIIKVCNDGAKNRIVDFIKTYREIWDSSINISCLIAIHHNINDNNQEHVGGNSKL